MDVQPPLQPQKFHISNLIAKHNNEKHDDGNNTTAAGSERSFEFDRAYWSHDERGDSEEGSSAEFATQKTLFDELGFAAVISSEGAR